MFIRRMIEHEGCITFYWIYEMEIRRYEINESSIAEDF